MAEQAWENVQGTGVEAQWIAEHDHKYRATGETRHFLSCYLLRDWPQCTLIVAYKQGIFFFFLLYLYNLLS